MKYEIHFTGTDVDKTDQAWNEILAYLGKENTPMLEGVRNQVAATTDTVDGIVNMISMLWGIEGTYPCLALKQFLLGEREV